MPCSLSSQVTHDLLREELKYEGVIVTDCLEMDAVKETYGIEKGSLLALQAGADVVMICHTYESQRGAVELVWDAVGKGELELTASKPRIIALKDQYSPAVGITSSALPWTSMYCLSSKPQTPI